MLKIWWDGNSKDEQILLKIGFLLLGIILWVLAVSSICRSINTAGRFITKIITNTQEQNTLQVEKQQSNVSSQSSSTERDSSSSNPTSNGGPCHGHECSMADAWCKTYLKKFLKSPSSARFPWYNEDYVWDNYDGSYLVSSYVDAENSFGAKIRTNYYCVVKDSGKDDYWDLVFLDFDE